MIKIDDDIPIPETGPGLRRFYPFPDLAVGQSFFVPGRTLQSLAGSITHARRAFPNRRFVARTTENGVRIWRIE